jgi:hypothetical protein
MELNLANADRPLRIAEKPDHVPIACPLADLGSLASRIEEEDPAPRGMEACNAFCSAGSATLTTVPSMNAMLDPRMVVTSTIRPTACGIGLSFRIDRISTSFLGLTYLFG